MSYLSALQNQLSALNNQKAGIESQISLYKNRSADITDLINSLKNIVDNEYCEANIQASIASGSINLAITGTSCPGAVEEQIYSDFEKNSEQDVKVSSAVANLTTELNNTNAKIDSLGVDLAKVNQNISNKQREINSEKLRLAEEERKRKEEEKRKLAESAAMTLKKVFKGV